MKFKVSYSLAKDLFVYLNFLYKFSSFKHGRDDIQQKLLACQPEEFVNQLTNAKNDEQAKVVITNHLKKQYQQKHQEYKLSAQNAEKYFNKKSSDIISVLEKIYDNKFPFPKITIYFSTGRICPYDYKDRCIFINYFATLDRQLQIIIHELNHFMFYCYFPDLEKELGREKLESLKEALTVLTNPEEQGYPAQQKLRKWLKTQKGTIPEIIKEGEWKKYL